MSLARCISAISAGDLIIRQPAVTGSALTYSMRRRFLLHAVEDEEAQPLFDADASGRDAAILQDLRDEPIGALVLLPRPRIVGRRT